MAIIACILARTVCRDPFSRFSSITYLLMESERELDNLKCELVTQNVSGNSKAKEDLQRRLREWEWKAHLFRKMKTNYEEACKLRWLLLSWWCNYDVMFCLFRYVCTGIPGPPSDVRLHVSSNRSLTVTFGEPEEKNGAMVTRYKSESPLLLHSSLMIRSLAKISRTISFLPPPLSHLDRC